MPSTLFSDTGDGPVAKRQKLSNSFQSGIRRGQASRIFAPFRTIGLVSSTEVPFTSIPLGKSTFQITTSVGRCLQTYDLKRGLNLVFLTRPQTPENVTASFAWKDKIFAAWCKVTERSRPGLWVFKRGKKVGELATPEDLDQPFRQVLVFGSWVVACCSTRIEVWRSSNCEHYTSLHLKASTKGGNGLTSICTMPTFLNKVFAARRDGCVDIWNVSTGKLIYTILPLSVDCGFVTAMHPTPALSLMAIAYSKGPIAIHNVRTDRTVIHLHSNTPITSISFRTDGLGAGQDGRGVGVMATAGFESGDVTFWDLNNGGRVMGTLRGAHDPPSANRAFEGGGINRIEFLVGQPVIITGGLDNSLKSWIFDETSFSPLPRILHSRSGHAAPITRLQFLPSGADDADAGGKWLLSAGADRSLWGWSLRRDGQSAELSQGNIKKKAKKFGLLTLGTLANEPSATIEDLKAPEITCIASSLNRDGGMGAFAGNGIVWQKSSGSQKKPSDAVQSSLTGWESVVTGHRGDKYARTWFWGRRKAGRWAFETQDGSIVSSVAISPCGTFAFIGSESGGIDMFNLQSGLYRQCFPSKLTQAQARKLRLQPPTLNGEAFNGHTKSKFQSGLGRHTKAVTGLVVDSLNRHVVSCSYDGKVKFWDFSTGYLVDEIDWSLMSANTGMCYYASSDLIAVACDDMAIRVVDIETKKTIREFWGCKDKINDFCFSNDGRWIIAASADRVLRVWDLPTGHLIDAMRMLRPCTTLAFSTTGEFLATACKGEIGVDIWSNKTLFTHVPKRHILERDIAEIEGPTVSGEGGQGFIEEAFVEDEDTEDPAAVQSLDQLSDEMMTLSLVPKSRWQTLLHLDLIKERNKPKEPPKVPEKAPFFLPSLENAKPVAISSEKSENNLAERSRIMKIGSLNSEAAFTSTLKAGRENSNYDDFISLLKTLSPSAADLEIRSMNPGTESELVSFVCALTSRLKQKRDYELVQAWMSVFLRLHSDAIASDVELVKALKEWREEQLKEGRRLGDLIGYCSGVVSFLRNPRT